MSLPESSDSAHVEALTSGARDLTDRTITKKLAGGRKDHKTLKNVVFTRTDNKREAERDKISKVAYPLV